MNLILKFTNNRHLQWGLPAKGISLREEPWRLCVAGHLHLDHVAGHHYCVLGHLGHRLGHLHWYLGWDLCLVGWCFLHNTQQGCHSSWRWGRGGGLAVMLLMMLMEVNMRPGWAWTPEPPPSGPLAPLVDWGRLRLPLCLHILPLTSEPCHLPYPRVEPD